jgi:ABC-type transport system involved in multi-copper enzyme maturation permease subunit
MIGAATVCGAAFSRERDKSTLGFMLVTPLPTMNIVLGKFFGILSPMLITIGVFTAWHLLLSIPLVWDVKLVELLVFLVFFVTVPFMITLLSGSFGLFWSTVFRRESDASGMGFLGMVFLMFGIFIVTGLAYGTPWTPALFTDVPRLFVWYACLLLCTIILCPLTLRLTLWRLNRARQGDIAFESASVQA